MVGIDGRSRRLDALDRERALVKRLCRVAGGILDRQPGDAGLDRARDVGGDLLRLMRKPALEIGVDGQIDGRAQRGKMSADIVQRDAIVGLCDRPRKACAGRGDRLEPHVLQRSRAADIPGVRQHEAAGLVHLVERRPLVGCRDRHDLSPFVVCLARE